MKRNELELMRTLGDMVSMAYWYNSASKHCGSDMHQDCIICRHFNFCQATDHFSHIFKREIEDETENSEK